jgi:TRAP-type C4-dicarboxylate transport system permease small subunit
VTVLTRSAVIALRAVRVAAAAWVIACFVVMCIAVWAQVGGRYLLNYSIAWTEELATISQIWMVLVGAGVAARHDMHARIEVLLALFPLRIRRALTLATLALGLVFLAAVAIGAQPMIRLGQFQTSPALGIPMWIPYLGLVVGPAYFAVEMIAATARNWTHRPDPAAEAVENEGL